MKHGEFELSLISDGELWLDGGAMFGVVPRTLWERVAPPDDGNRIRLGLNCLLIRTPDYTVLIDSGCGEKLTDKQVKIYRLQRQTGLLDALREVAVPPEEIDFVINTHLHFDHCGGNTRATQKGLAPTFPNAIYIVDETEYRAAMNPSERTRASYFPENWLPLERAGLLRMVADDEEIVPGVQVVHTPGHTAGHLSVKVSSGDATLFYMADLCPTSAHVPLPWIMAYDLYPLATLETRRRVYQRAAAEGWLLFFEHDPSTPLGRLHEKDGNYTCNALPWPD